MRDIDIRRALNRDLPKLFHDDYEGVSVDEFGICQGVVRADVVVINGSIHGFEIKSDSDTLERLPSQMQVYNKVFETMTIVSAKKHLQNIRQLVPNWWGIMVVKETECTISLEEIRKTKKNPSIDPLSLVQLLWRDEALSLLENYKISNGLKNKPRGLLWSTLAQKIPLDQLAEEVRLMLKKRESLKTRNNWKVALPQK